MAKGKHATALFEVIHSSKHFGGKDKAAGLLRTPKWWFKGRQKENDPTRNAGVQPVVTAAPSSAGADDAGPARVDPTASADASPASGAPPARAPAVDLVVEPERQRITFRVTYTSAIVTCFAIGMIVALAYLVGRHMARGPAQAMGGPSTEQIRQGPARPDVMDVGRGGGGGGAVDPARNAQRPVQPEPEDGISSNSSQPRTAPPPRNQQPNQPVPQPGRRVNGLNYMIIQGYPDEASAKAAVDILRQHNVAATIEKGLRGYKSDWHLVVGMEGFARIGAPECQQYMRRIKDISDKFVGRRSFKAFEPMGYRWDRP